MGSFHAVQWKVQTQRQHSFSERKGFNVEWTSKETEGKAQFSLPTHVLCGIFIVGGGNERVLGLRNDW